MGGIVPPVEGRKASALLLLEGFRRHSNTQLE